MSTAYYNKPFIQTLKAQLGLNDDQVREFKDAFDIFDEDCGGTVSTAELSNVMKALGQDISEDDVSVMISEVDSDGRFDEFPVRLYVMWANMRKRNALGFATSVRIPYNF